MKSAVLPAFVLCLNLLPGCASIESALQPGVVRTFEAPIARVKPVFITTLTQMGMPISAIEVRGRNEVVKSKKAGKSVEIEFERLGASSTRVRVSGSDEDRIMRETERRLGVS